MSINTPESADQPSRPMIQKVGAILWPSFFAAGVATMVFFAFIDPLQLRNREAGYTIGFFMFWLATASASLFTWILLRPASRFNKPLPKEP